MKQVFYIYDYSSRNRIQQRSRQTDRQTNTRTDTTTSR